MDVGCLNCCVFIVTMLRTNKTTLRKVYDQGYNEDTTAQGYTLRKPTDDSVILLKFFFEFSRESTDASWFTLYPGGEMFVNCKLCDSEIYAKDSVKHWPQLHLVCILLSTSWFFLD